MSENTRIYDSLRSVPKDAQKTIIGGKLKGKTDINPMWRIKALTELFGACGVGWNVINENHQLVPVESTGEVICLYSLDLIYKLEDGSWSDPVHGIGGNMLVEKTKNGLQTNDDGVKMAKTDAIGSAAKMLGCAADIYWATDATKYSKDTEEEPPAPAPSKPAPAPSKPAPAVFHCNDCGQEITETIINGKAYSASAMVKATVRGYGTALCLSCKNERDAEIADINRDERLYAECVHEDAGDRD